jgi:hypothetical protein
MYVSPLGARRFNVTLLLDTRASSPVRGLAGVTL